MSGRFAKGSGIAAILWLAVLAACQYPSGTQPAQAPAAAPAPRDATLAQHFVVDGARSDLHVLVYRGGAMARLGHNHVISSAAVSGDVYLDDALDRSRLRLVLPVDGLVVDDARARAAEGEDFAAPVPPEAREATRHNLLGPAVLDGGHFPQLELESVAIAGTRSSPRIGMRITIRGVSRQVPITASVQEGGDRLVASGAFEIRQSDFGITPFSVALGALQVQDTLRIRFRIVALRATAKG